jgi:hypothetical protein
MDTGLALNIHYKLAAAAATAHNREPRTTSVMKKV